MKVILFLFKIYILDYCIKPFFCYLEQALVDFYNGCCGTDWIHSDNWTVGDPCSNNWFGVFCESSHIVSLYVI